MLGLQASSWQVPSELTPIAQRQAGPGQEMLEIHWEDQKMSDDEEGGCQGSTLQVQVLLIWTKYPVIMKDTTQTRLGPYMLKHIYMVQSRGELVPQESTVEYIDFYIHILELEAQAYLQQKMQQGSLALTPDGVNLIPSIPIGP